MDRAKTVSPAPGTPTDEPTWPSPIRSREELDAALEEGFASGASELSHAEIIAEARKALGLG